MAQMSYLLAIHFHHFCVRGSDSLIVDGRVNLASSGAPRVTSKSIEVAGDLLLRSLLCDLGAQRVGNALQKALREGWCVHDFPDRFGQEHVPAMATFGDLHDQRTVLLLVFTNP